MRILGCEGCRVVGPDIGPDVGLLRPTSDPIVGRIGCQKLPWARKQRGKSSHARPHNLRVWKQETAEAEGGCGQYKRESKKKSTRQGHIRNTMSKVSGMIWKALSKYKEEHQESVKRYQGFPELVKHEKLTKLHSALNSNIDMVLSQTSRCKNKVV